jgi:paraquat-inducible protein B
MSQRANPAVIGAFVVGALALVVVGLVVFGGVNLLHRPLKVVMYFDESVNGLAVGAPISYRGVKVGTVTGVRAEVGTTRIAVYGELDPASLSGSTTKKHDARDDLARAIQNGLRAQLGVTSIVTGQLFVSLVVLPDTAPITVGLEPTLTEIPTVPTLLQQFVDRFEKIVAAVEDLPWDRLFKAGLDTLEGVRDVARAPELTRTLRSADAALADFQKLVRTVEREAGPLIASLRDTSDTSRGVVKDVGQDLKQVLSDTRPVLSSLRDTSEAARSGVGDIAQDVRKTLGELSPLIAKLESAADAARVALDKSQSLLGEADATLGAEPGLGYQLAQTLRELTAAARSLRGLTDFLEQHPDAILFGRGKPGGQ